MPNQYSFFCHQNSRPLSESSFISTTCQWHKFLHSQRLSSSSFYYIQRPVCIFGHLGWRPIYEAIPFFRSGEIGVPLIKCLLKSRAVKINLDKGSNEIFTPIWTVTCRMNTSSRYMIIDEMNFWCFKPLYPSFSLCKIINLFVIHIYVKILIWLLSKTAVPSLDVWLFLAKIRCCIQPILFHTFAFLVLLRTTKSSNGKTYFLYFRPMEIETKNSARFGFVRTIHLCSFLEVGP